METGDPKLASEEIVAEKGAVPLEMLGNESDAVKKRAEDKGEDEHQCQTVKILHFQYEVKKLEAKIRRMQKDMKKKDEKILDLLEELGWADDDQLKEIKTKKEKRKDSKQKAAEEKLRQQAHLIPEETIWRFFFKFAGFSRFSMLSDEWHALNPSAANQLFGFRTWKEAKDVVQEKFPWMEMKPPQIFQVYNDKGDLDLELRECNPFEQCFAVKMMDRTGLTAKRVALLYGRDKRAITKWKQKWIPKWGLPGYNAAGEDDDGDTNKRKAGTARPFQSRQMINPVKRKKAPVENSDIEPGQPAQSSLSAAAGKEREHEPEPGEEHNQDDDDDDDDDELDAAKGDDADSDDDKLPHRSQVEDTSSPRHVSAATSGEQSLRETNHVLVDHPPTDVPMGLGSPPLNFHPQPFAAAPQNLPAAQQNVFVNNLQNQSLHTQSQLNQNMHTQNLQAGLQNQNLQGHNNLQDFVGQNLQAQSLQNQNLPQNLQDLAAAQYLQAHNLQDLQNLQAQGLQAHNFQDFAVAQNLQGVAGAPNLTTNLQPNLQDLYDYLLPASKRPRYHGYF